MVGALCDVIRFITSTLSGWSLPGYGQYDCAPLILIVFDCPTIAFLRCRWRVLIPIHRCAILAPA